jgi:hypothetical protein
MKLPLYLLKRHPLAVEAFFDFVFVLTFAYPKQLLLPLLSPGLKLDTYEDLGFLAIACVQTKHLRPKGMPARFGQNFFLVGHRLFVRFENFRGLQILRSDADKPLMISLGNAMTHYKYHRIRRDIARDEHHLAIDIRSEDKKSDIKVDVNLDVAPEYLPPGSPFPTLREAMKFAGPMPFTFDYERETNSIVRVEGARQNWVPKSVEADVKYSHFIQQPPFNQSEPKLCSAFFMENIPYHWKPGVVHKLNGA